MRRAHSAALAAALFLVSACETTSPRPPSPPPPDNEERLVPEINKGFRHPQLDTERAIGIYEAESREIAARRNEITAALELAAGMTAADIGAGTGLFMKPFADAVGSGGKVYAVDVSPRLVDYMRERAKTEDLPQAEVLLSTDRSTRLPEDSVDVAFVCDTYHHFEFPRTMLSDLHRALKSGGKLVLVEFALVPGVTREWLFDHVRGNQEDFRKEIEAAGFVFEKELDVGLKENYVLRFARP